MKKLITSILAGLSIVIILTLVFSLTSTTHTSSQVTPPSYQPVQKTLTAKDSLNMIIQETRQNIIKVAQTQGEIKKSLTNLKRKISTQSQKLYANPQKKRKAVQIPDIVRVDTIAKIKEPPLALEPEIEAIEYKYGGDIEGLWKQPEGEGIFLYKFRKQIKQLFK